MLERLRALMFFARPVKEPMDPPGPDATDRETFILDPRRFRDVGALHGYYGHPQDEGLKVVDEHFSAQVKNPPPPSAPSPPRANIQQDIDRLEEIKNSVETRLTTAEKAVANLTESGVAPAVARVLIGTGWLAFAALGMALSGVVGVLLNVSASEGVPNAPSDLFALVANAITDLRGALTGAFPGSGSFDWVIVLSGIALVLAAVVLYMAVNKVANRYDQLDWILSVSAPRLPSAGLGDLHDGTEQAGSRRRLLTILSVLCAVLGLGILLSFQESPHAISASILGYAVAAVCVGTTCLLVQRESASGERAVYLLPRVARITTVALAGVLAASWIAAKVIDHPSYKDALLAACILSLLGLLLIGAAALPVGYRYQNHYFILGSLIRLRVQIDSRLRIMRHQMLEPSSPENEPRGMGGEALREEALERISALAMARAWYRDGYSVGQLAREHGLRPTSGAPQDT